MFILTSVLGTYTKNNIYKLGKNVLFIIFVEYIFSKVGGGGEVF